MMQKFLRLVICLNHKCLKAQVKYVFYWNKTDTQFPLQLNIEIPNHRPIYTKLYCNIKTVRTYK